MVAKFDANTLGEEAEQSRMFIYGYNLDKARVLIIDYCLTKPGENSFHFFALQFGPLLFTSMAPWSRMHTMFSSNSNIFKTIILNFFVMFYCIYLLFSYCGYV